MTAFEICINGKKFCTAGLDEPGVVTSILSWVRADPKGRDTVPVDRLDFRIAGLRTRTETHLTWRNRDLCIGDEVNIKILAKAKVDRPTRKRSSAEMNALAAKFKHKFQKR